jgi:hypothetical protein
MFKGRNSANKETDSQREALPIPGVDDLVKPGRKGYCGTKILLKGHKKMQAKLFWKIHL